MQITITSRNNSGTDSVLDGIVTTILRDRDKLNADGGFVLDPQGHIVAEYEVSI